MFQTLRRALVFAVLALPAVAQDEYAAQTATDPKVDRATLQLQLRPLTADQLTKEADAWLQVLVGANQTLVAKQLEVNAATGAERSTRLGELTPLQEARTQAVDRLGDALSALESKGGDIASYEAYVKNSGLEIDVFDVEAVWTTVTAWLISPEGGIRYALNIIKFLVTLIAFKILGGILSKLVKKAMDRVKNASDLLRSFFVNVVRKLTFFIGLIVALSMLEVNIGPFVAAIGAAGFVIGFALQGTLSNFAAGIMILVYRPYDIGEVVTVAGQTGKVDAMSLVSTTLRLPDNQVVVIPNGSIWGDVITNITGQENRRVDMVFGCGYDDDLQKAQELLLEIVKAHPKVLPDPDPVVKVSELADSSVNFIVRPWARTSDYWDVVWDVTREVKDRFDAAGLSIPYPQQDVHMHQSA